MGIIRKYWLAMASIGTWMLPGHFSMVGQHLCANNVRKSVPGPQVQTEV